MGPAKEWPWIDFDPAIIDYDVILKAPEHLNSAGLGDVLCGYAPIAEWRRNSRLGIGPKFDQEATATAMGHFNEIRVEFPKTFDREDNLTKDSIHLIVTAIQERDDKTLKHPAAPAADHPIWLAAEEINQKTWIQDKRFKCGR